MDPTDNEINFDNIPKSRILVEKRNLLDFTSKPLKIDKSIYGVVINKIDIENTNRRYFFCSREDLDDGNEKIMTFETRSESNFIEIWERDVHYLNQNTTKVTDGVELITDSSIPEIKSEPLPSIYRNKKELIELV